MRHRPASYLAVIAFVCACNDAAAPPPPGILRTASRDDVPTLDPAVGYDTVSWLFEQMLYSTLLDYDDEGRLVPELAESWDVSDDGRVYTFVLRQARFSNGRAVRAEDVKVSMERVLHPRTRSPGVEFYLGIRGAREFVDGDAADVAGIEVEGDRTVRFRLAAPDPLFLHELALQFAAVLPRASRDAGEDDFAANPVGSGPFVLSGWDRGRELRLRRNPLYFRPGLPKLDGIHHVVGLSEQLEWMKYESGELDVANVAPSEFPRVIRDPAYRRRLVSETSMTTFYLGMNCRMPPFDDVQVRRALSSAIDREKALRIINDRGEAAHGILPPGIPGYDATLGGAVHDPARARALLAAAGLGAAGFETVLWTRTDETQLRLAQSYQQDLAAVGIRVRIRDVAWGTLIEAVRSGQGVPLFALGWQADFPDPSNFLEVLFHSKSIGANNNTFFADPEVDRLLDRAARTIDAGMRLNLLRGVHRRVVAAAPWAPLYYPVTYQILHPRVRGYRLHPLRPPRLEEVSVQGE